MCGDCESLATPLPTKESTPAFRSCFARIPWVRPIFPPPSAPRFLYLIEVPYLSSSLLIVFGVVLYSTFWFRNSRSQSRARGWEVLGRALIMKTLGPLLIKRIWTRAPWCGVQRGRRSEVAIKWVSTELFWGHNWVEIRVCVSKAN